MNDPSTRDGRDGERHGERHGGRHNGRPRAEPRQETEEKPPRGGRMGRIMPVGLCVLVVVWAVLNLVFEQAAVAVFSQGQQGGWHAITKLDKSISALILLLLSLEAGRHRLRWVAAGFLVLASAEFAFAFVDSAFGGVTADANAQVWDRLFIYSFAAGLFTVGLALKTPPRLRWRWGLALLALLYSVGAIAALFTGSLPPLVTASGWGVDDMVGRAPFPGLTGWHYALFLIPLGLSIVATVGTARYNRGRTVGGWLTLAMVLFVGSLVHQFFWPLPHGEVLTSTSLLHSAPSAIVVIGGILEFRRIATERSALLAAEQEQTNRLRELSASKADFTAMVAHELASPLAAIQGHADVLSSGELPQEDRERSLEAIRVETGALNALIADVRAAAKAERGDFAVEARPTDLGALLADATAYAHTLPGEHPLVEKVEVREEERVLADAERIGQILRNLLQNAVKYSEPGTPIELRATRGGPGRVRVEVADRGPGIRADDAEIIFEKFGRNRNGNGRSAAGAGVGLYLSRHIARAHGGDLTVETRPGGGSVFVFELEVAR